MLGNTCIATVMALLFCGSQASLAAQGNTEQDQPRRFAASLIRLGASDTQTAQLHTALVRELASSKRIVFLDSSNPLVMKAQLVFQMRTALTPTEGTIAVSVIVMFSHPTYGLMFDHDSLRIVTAKTVDRDAAAIVSEALREIDRRIVQ